jgi:hypothetical protein
VVNAERIPVGNVNLQSLGRVAHRSRAVTSRPEFAEDVELLNGRAGYEWLARAWVMHRWMTHADAALAKEITKKSTDLPQPHFLS